MHPQLDDQALTRPIETEEEGGPVKTFLEHLEDLRWTLIKSLAALGVGFIVCLLAANWITRVLIYPLRVNLLHSQENIRIPVYIGTNKLGTFTVSKTDLPNWGFSTTDRYLALQVTPIATGSNVMLLGLKPMKDFEHEEDQPLAELVTLGPAASFIVAFKIALYGGCVLAAPFILYFIGEFVFPALKRNEKKYVLQGLLIGGGLFIVGVLFCYFIMIPISLNASVQFSHWLGFSVNQWRAEEYFSFVTQFMLAMGLGFQIPVIILILVKLGVLNHKMLSQLRPYVVVINLTLSAILTPPDVMSQLLMAVPLQLMYELTVLIARLIERRGKAETT